MNEQLISMTKHMYVHNSPRPAVHFTSGSNTNSLNLAGTVRYDSGGIVQVFDGHSWVSLTTSPGTVGLTYEAEQALDWAIKQMKLEKEAEKLAKDFPAVQAALDCVTQARKQLEVIVELTKDHDGKPA